MRKSHHAEGHAVRKITGGEHQHQEGDKPGEKTKDGNSPLSRKTISSYERV
jgi:hypothetical protein